MRRKRLKSWRKEKKEKKLDKEKEFAEVSATPEKEEKCCIPG